MKSTFDEFLIGFLLFSLFSLEYSSKSIGTGLKLGRLGLEFWYLDRGGYLKSEEGS